MPNKGVLKGTDIVIHNKHRKIIINKEEMSKKLSTKMQNQVQTPQVVEVVEEEDQTETQDESQSQSTQLDQKTQNETQSEQQKTQVEQSKPAQPQSEMQKAQAEIKVLEDALKQKDTEHTELKNELADLAARSVELQNQVHKKTEEAYTSLQKLTVTQTQYLTGLINYQRMHISQLQQQLQQLQPPQPDVSVAKSTRSNNV